MSEIAYWIWLAQRRQLSPASARRCLEHFGSVLYVYEAEEELYRFVPELRSASIRTLMDKSLDEAERIMENCRRLGVRILCLNDAAYPEKLRNIYDAPLVLYVKGSLPVVDDEPCVAVVGTRKATPYGRRCARRFGTDLVHCGGVVVSGLAEGIDSEAMKAALDAGGTVIGVLGTGVDRVYPAWNGPLQEAAARHGALVSEFPPGTHATRASFPRRNRIISGLSDGVVVIEAPEKSGSLLTAARAAEQGRDVYVVPGPIDDKNYVGSNLLIRDGAALVQNAWEVLSVYIWRYPKKIRRGGGLRALFRGGRERSAPSGGPEADLAGERAAKKTVDKAETVDYIDVSGGEELSPAERAVLTALADEALQTDEIIRRAGLETAEVLSAVTLLELSGLIRRLEGDYLERVP